jgi:hypothetical protein
MMTKVQALAEFREFYLREIRKIEQANGNGVDEIMRREEWNNYTDALCKDRRITSRQYETWSNPF